VGLFKGAQISAVFGESLAKTADEAVTEVFRGVGHPTSLAQGTVDLVGLWRQPRFREATSMTPSPTFNQASHTPLQLRDFSEKGSSPTELGVIGVKLVLSGSTELS